MWFWWFYIGGAIGMYPCLWAEIFDLPPKKDSFFDNIFTSTTLALLASSVWPIAAYVWVSQAISDNYEIKSRFKIGLKENNK